MLQLKGLLKKIGGGGDAEGEYIIGIILKEDTGIGLLIKTSSTSKRVELVEAKKFSYSNSWGGIVYDIDELLFGLENQYKISLKQAIFFVYSHFTDRTTGALNEPYATALSEIVKSNRLESKGYIVYSEAVANYLKFTEQSPLSTVIVEVDSPAVSAFVYRGGNIIFSDTVAKTESIVNDLEEIFKKTSRDVTLPPRITMYDSSSLSEESGKILRHTWDEKLFIQLPKVEVVQEDAQYQALLAAYSQMEYSVIPVLSTSPAVVPLAPVTASVDEVGDDQKEPATEEKADLDSDYEENHDDEVDSGVKINEADDEVRTENVAGIEGEGPQPSEIDGFLIGGDVALNASEQIGMGAEPVSPMSSSSNDYAVPYQNRSNNIVNDQVTPESPKKNLFKSMLTFIKIPRFTMPSSKKKILIPLGTIIFIAGIAFLILYFGHKATVTLFYKSPTLKKSLSVNDIAIHEQTKSFSAKATLKTSGTKEIGEKADGEITIFNAKTESRSLPKGTKLKTDSGLSFVLSDQVTIDAATSSITDEGDILTTTSKKTAKAEAAEIGTKYNIGNDVKMTIEGIPDTQVFARTTESFKGGTQKEVQTASKEDFKKIDKELEQKLTKESEDSMKKMHTTEALIKDLTEIDMSKKTYSKELAEEAKTLDAEAQAKLTVMTYDENEVKNQLIEKMRSDVPSGYMLSGNNVEIKLTKAKKDEKTKKVNVTFDLVAKPELIIDRNQLLTSIKGKQVGQLESILQNSFHVIAYKVDPIGGFTLLQGIVPFFDRNITLKVEPMQ